MGNPYAIEIQAGDTSGPVVYAGDLTFTDPANQPADGGNAAKIDGVTVTGVPSAGQIIVATAAAAAHWADQLGAALAYVTVQATPPAGPYQTPLVLDTTAVTGGCYAWDGAAYQQISSALS